MRLKMRLEDAMVYVVATAGYGMTTQRIAEVINNERLHIRVDGNPVTDKQVYAAVCRKPETFVKEGGRILLSMWKLLTCTANCAMLMFSLQKNINT